LIQTDKTERSTRH